MENTVFGSVRVPLPGDVVYCILAQLDIKDLLQIRVTCKDGARIAAAGTLWKPIVGDAWKYHAVKVMSASMISPMDLCRRMHVPPEPITAMGSRWNYRVPVPPLRIFGKYPENSKEATAEAIGKYRIHLEITHVDGTKILRQVVRPFPGMLDWDQQNWEYGPHDKTSVREAATVDVEDGCAVPFETPPVPPSQKWEPFDYPFTWQREAFGTFRTLLEGKDPIDRMYARICIEHNGEIVCLGKKFGSDLKYFADKSNPQNDAAVVFFQFNLPVLSLPEELIAEFGHLESFSVAPTLYLDVRPTSATRDEWKASSFSFEMDPCPEPYWSEGVARKTDEMLLCCLSEAIETSRRTMFEYEDKDDLMEFFPESDPVFDL